MIISNVYNQWPSNNILKAKTVPNGAKYPDFFINMALLAFLANVRLLFKCCDSGKHSSLVQKSVDYIKIIL